LLLGENDAISCIPILSQNTTKSTRDQAVAPRAATIDEGSPQRSHFARSHLERQHKDVRHCDKEKDVRHCDKEKDDALIQQLVAKCPRLA